MKAKILTVLFLLAVCSSLSVGVQAPMSRVAGLVLDANEARIVGATITVQNAQVKRVGRSDDEGRFAVSVPSGTYQITVEQHGFKKFQMAGFRVGAESSELNVHLEVAPPQLPLKVSPSNSVH